MNTLEFEREKLNRLLELGASKEEIQAQSEIVDRYIVDFYKKVVGDGAGRRGL